MVTLTLLFIILTSSTDTGEVKATVSVETFSVIHNGKTCKVADWNMITTKEVPNEAKHKQWAMEHIGDFPNLFDAMLRPVSAFVYKEEIVVTTTAQNRYGKKVYCRYFDCNREELYGTAWETIMFPLSAAYCIRRAGAMFMSLTDMPYGSLITEPVPITLRIADDYKYDISVCVGPIYGKEKRWMVIAETTEHHLLMGIQHFYYTILDTMDEYSRKLVDEYERLGYFEVTVIQNEYSTMDWMSHLLQVHDCHFRSRYHSKWVLNVDIDERLMVVSTPLQSLLNNIDPKYGELIFGSKRVLTTEILPEKYPGKEEILNVLQFRKFNKTTNAAWDSPKVFFRPEKVENLFYHWSYAQYHGVYVASIPVSDAFILHYRTGRPSLHGVWYMKKKFTKTKLDDTFEKNLTNRVVQRLESVYDQRTIRCEEIRQELIGKFSHSNYNCRYKNGTLYN